MYLQCEKVWEKTGTNQLWYWKTNVCQSSLHADAGYGKIMRMK